MCKGYTMCISFNPNSVVIAIKNTDLSYVQELESIMTVVCYLLLPLTRARVYNDNCLLFIITFDKSSSLQ